jgi:hypothetical protein
MEGTATTSTGFVCLDEEESHRKEFVGDVVKDVAPSNNPVVRTNDIAVAVAVAADADAGKTRCCGPCCRLQVMQLLLRLRILAIIISHSKEKAVLE